MFDVVMTTLSALSAFATVTVSGDVVRVTVEDVVLTDTYDEVTPDTFDEDTLENVLEALAGLASSVSYAPYAYDTYTFDGFSVRVAYVSSDI